MEKPIDHKNFFYPPGGILIWIIIGLELVTFMGGLVAFAVFRSNNIELVQESQHHLSSLIGTINTMILITGGFFYIWHSQPIFIDSLLRPKNFFIWYFG